MNITLSANEKLIEKAREYAKEHNSSLNKMVRAFLESVVSESENKSDIDFFMNTIDRLEGDSEEKPWKREELYDI